MPVQPAADPLPLAAAEARADRRLVVAVATAVALPPLLAWNLPPSATMFNQLSALALWGAVLALLAARIDAGEWRRAVRRNSPLLAVLAAVAAFALSGWVFGPLPASLALPPAFVVVTAIAVASAAGAAALAPGLRRALLAGFVIAGVAGAGVAVVQVFAPGWADGHWIARSSSPGRAVGNLRQPNHHATLLLWAAVALVPLVDARTVPRTVATAVWVLLIVAVELTGSRTGLVGVALLALWGGADRRLAAWPRALLLAAPLVYALAAGLSWALAQQGAPAVGVATRVGEADVSGRRFAIWANAVELVAAQPWTGVGFGRFNFAWTLTPFALRPREFFDHVHNLPLQFAVEFGLPAAVVLTALLLLALGRAATHAWRAADATPRALWIAVLLAGVHSALEYPLWYAHFLLPAAWAWGACQAPGAAAGVPRRVLPLLRAAGLAVTLAAAAAVVDYLRVARIYAPPAHAAPLVQRIAEGQRSVLFGHHADYAAATVNGEPVRVLAAASRAAYHLLDARLLRAWAEALARTGDVDRARHLAARLREFAHPDADAFFAACDAPRADGAPPFQCEAPVAALGWRDFVR